MSDKKRILVAEDEDALRKMIALELEAAGYEVVQVENGEKALFEASKGNINLIISDVLMPKMDGFQFYKELKKNKLTANIPVLILTARGKMEDTFRIFGVDEFVAKPFESESLLATINELLSAQSSAPVAAQSFAETPAEVARSEDSSTGKRILLAGDNEEVLEGMSEMLKGAGCQTDLVTTGSQVISKVVMFLPNVLILDLLVYGIESQEVVRILREMPQGEKIPILLFSFYRLSDLGSEDVRQRALSVDTAETACLEAGATEYLGRYNENTFMAQVAKYIK